MVITFPADYNGFESFAQPENVQRIEKALRERTGRAWSVRLERKPTGALSYGTSANGQPAPRMRPQEAMQQVPLLARALEVFGALPMSLDQNFGVATLPVEPSPATEMDREEA